MRWTWSAAIVLAVGLAGCGGSKKASTGAQHVAAPTVLALSISEAGKTSSYTAPSSVSGGLVTVQLSNAGKKIHGAQLLRIESGHTVQEAIKAVGGESNKTPEWIRAEGGVGAAPPGGSAAATVNLPAGAYAVVDFAGAHEGPGSGPPAIAQMAVTAAASPASLPSTGTTITAANPAKDRYKWEISGPLKTGANAITLASKGRKALHELSAARITADVPLAKIVKDLQSEHGPPPSYVDRSVNYSTAVLDGGKSETTQMLLTKPGKYVFICHLTDRDGGKPHFAEGLITTVTVK